MEHRSGLVPYLFYDSAAAMIDWYKRAFGFAEHSRYSRVDGGVRNAEMIVGGTELWMDGNQPADRQPSAVQRIGVWVDDPEEMYENQGPRSGD